jgi:nifR3 family TIM-barrel protein
MNLKNKIFLAPLSQYTSLAFRVLCQGYGAEAGIVPLVCAKAICANKRKIKELDPHESEKFVGVQLFGSNSTDIEESSRHITQNHPYVKFIDINCACPVPKVMKTGSGSALLLKPDLAAQLISAARKCDKPITVKMRILNELDKTVQFAKTCEQAGASAIFVHGRTQVQGYSGTSNWSMIKSIAQSVDIPVIGSGDIRSIEQGKQLQKQTDCSGFMIGRAAMSDPAIFSSQEKSTHQRKHKLFLEYLDICNRFSSIFVPDLRNKAIQFFSGFKHSTELRVKIGQSKDLDELMKIIDIF